MNQKKNRKDATILMRKVLRVMNFNTNNSLSFNRNAGLGMNTFWTRVGGMAAPQIFFLVSISLSYLTNKQVLSGVLRTVT